MAFKIPHRMKRKLIKTAVLACLALGAFVYQKWFPTDGGSHRGGNDSSSNETTDRTYSRAIQYTKHAKCRMKCRKIDRSEVVYALKNGKTNRRKSDPNDQPCPTLAKEVTTQDQQEIRVVVGRCAQADKVITVIDLGEDHPCGRC